MAGPVEKTGDITVYCSFTQFVDIEGVVPNPRSPNKHSADQVKLLAKLIKAHGWRAPITVSNRSGFVVRGHCRLLSARLLKLDQVPVDYQDYKSEAEEYADLIADNRVAEFAEIDDVALVDMLRDLDSFGYDLNLTGYTGEDLDAIFAAAQGEVEVQEDEFDIDAAAAEIKEPITKRGDLWLLGKHRLLCGDSTKAEDVRRLMDGKRAILFSTDPPYLVDYDGMNHPSSKYGKDKNKDWSKIYGQPADWDESGQTDTLYDGFIKTAIEEAILPNAAWYCWHAAKRQALLEAVWNKYGAFLHQTIIWVKNNPVLTRSWYMWQHEPCFFGWIKGNKPPRTATNYPHSVWPVDNVRPGQKTEHPTSKPIKLFTIPMEQHTNPGDICYEPFCGSGSQIIAAEQLDRICYAIEVKPIFCDVIIRRWERFTGKKGARL